MKYIFIAHSHSLFLFSLGAISNLVLNNDDVIFLCTRNYQIPNDMRVGKIVDANDVYNRYDSYLGGNWMIAKKMIKEFDLWVSEICNDCYHLFIPHFASNFFKLLQSHHLCINTSLVQESAYSVEGAFVPKISRLNKIRNILYGVKLYGCTRIYPHGKWYVDGCLLSQKTIDVYEISNEFFKYMPNDITKIHLIEWPEIKKDLHLEHPRSPIFVFDGYVKNGVVDKNTYYQCFTRLINNYYSSHNYIKFHPAQSLGEREAIKCVFKELGVDYEEFPEDTPFEFYISKLKNLKIVGFSSSLIYFAHEAGHDVTAKSSWLLESPLFQEAVKNGQKIIDY